ncbi:MAG: phytoene desaturase family protein [Clostridium sp.]|uniref:phytoene desaturase family protein n=1 Tax=Clostridium sp. TaxID=1506 RepID=UPI003F2E625A
MKKVLIIGGGVSGLSAALRLQHLGYSVTILEKNSFIGGKTCLINNKFKFDLCATIPIIIEPYVNLFKDIGLNIHDYLTIKSIDPLYKVFFDYDCSNYIISSFIPKLKETLSSMAPKDFLNYLYLINKADRDFNKVNKCLLEKPLLSITNILSPYNANAILNTNSLKTTMEFLKENIKSRKLIEVLAFQSMYMGISPYESSSLFSMLPLINHSLGLFYIDGGTSAFINTLVKIFEKNGGCIKLNSEVSSILFNEISAYGVRLKNSKEIFSDIVVCSADFPYAIETLIPKKMKIENSYTTKDDLSCSSFMLYLVLNKKIDKLSLHNIIIKDNFKEVINHPFEGIVDGNSNLYIYCNSKLNSTSNEEYLTINLRVPNLLHKNIIWDDTTIKKVRDSIIATLSKNLNIKNFDNLILNEQVITPYDFYKYFNSYGGACYGIKPSIKNLLYFRPQCTIKNINNLYFVGASVHPGAGVSLALNSSKIAVNAIKKLAISK